MPGKLIAVIVLLGINVVLNLATKSWFGAVLGGALIAALVRGSHNARGIGIGLSALGLGFTVFTAATGANAVSGTELAPLFWSLIAFSAAQGGYTIWALTRADVIDWMDQRHGAGARGASSDEPPRYV